MARERELAAAERERVAARASESSATWLASKASEEGRLQRLGEEAAATTAAAAAALEEAGKEQRVADGLRKVGVRSVGVGVHQCVYSAGGSGSCSGVVCVFRPDVAGFPSVQMKGVLQIRCYTDFGGFGFTFDKARQQKLSHAGFPASSIEL